jgi:hypothetical protein
MEEDMTDQEMFDKVVTTLFKQGKRSVMPRRARTPAGTGMKQDCAYRGEGGVRCAAGVLIHDEHYTPALELEAPDDPRVSSALMSSGIHEGQISLVMDLQYAHDGGVDEEEPAETVQRWVGDFQEVAEKHGLSDGAICR